MRPERSFVAERALAQHCPELLAQSEGEALSGAHLAAFARAGTVMARDLAAVFAPLLGAEDLTLTAASPTEGDPAALAERIAPLAANSLLEIGSEGARMLVSLDAAPVFRIVDRTFGGKGDAPSPLPEAFAPSSEMMARRLAALVAAALGRALGLADDAVRSLRSDGALTALAPFGDTTPLALLALTVEQAGQPSWTIQLAVPLTALATLFRSKPRAVRPAGAPGADAQPWCDLPLTLSAVLVDMRLPVSALAGLRPDVILQVAVAREVPLRIGGTTLARGTVGTLDDRVAIQITQAF